MIWQNIVTFFGLLFGYWFLCLWIPSICLHRYVKDRGPVYRFIFYQVCGNMYLILWGFLLSYLRFFHTGILWVVLVALPLGFRVLRDVREARRNGKQMPDWMSLWIETLQNIFLGVYGGRKLARDLCRTVLRWPVRLYRKYIRGHEAELVGILAVLVFAVSYFGNAKFTHYAYASSDEVSHYYWIESLVHNVPFQDGIYPFGLHFLAAMIAPMFGLTVLRTTQMLGLLVVCLVFLFLYLYIRSVFSSRAAALGGWAFFVVGDFFQRATYSRFFSTIPMEFGIAAFFAMLYGLTDYVHTKKKTSFWLFVLALSWSFHIHMYVTIFAAFVLVMFGLVYLIRMIRQKVLHKIILGGLMAIVLSLTPFLIGIALGFGVQSSFTWAFGLIGLGADTKKQESQMPTVEEEIAEDQIDQEEENGLSAALSYRELFTDFESYGLVINQERSGILLAMDAFLLLYGILALLRKKSRKQGLAYVFLALAWAVSIFLCAMPSLGLPMIMQAKRIIIFWAILSVPLFAAPVQLLSDLLTAVLRSRRISDALLTVGVLAGAVFLVQHNLYKNIQGNDAIIPESEFRLALELQEHHEPRSWTVISQTYGRMALVYYGYHYEIIDLLAEMEEPSDEGIYIPTQDIYVVVEDLIDQYAADRIMGGVRRLNLYDEETRAGLCPPSAKLALTDLNQGEISEYLHSWRIYYYPFRAVVASKLYYWMERIKEVYPNHVSVYRQDDLTTIYRIHQDPYFPLNLAVDYRDGLRTAAK